MPSRKQQEYATIGTMALVIVAAYIAAQMLADITSNKLGTLAGLTIDLGTFIYPITFTLRDLIHKRLGKRNARIVIITAGAINIFMAGYIFFTAVYPSDPCWQEHHEAFARIFALTPRIVIASIVAEIVSELLDTEIYHWFVTRVTEKHQWARVLVSNSVSVPVDSLLFSLLAFAFSLSWLEVLGIFVSNCIIKYIVTVVSIPLIYIVRERGDGEKRRSTKPERKKE